MFITLFCDYRVLYDFPARSLNSTAKSFRWFHHHVYHAVELHLIFHETAWCSLREFKQWKTFNVPKLTTNKCFRWERTPLNSTPPKIFSASFRLLQKYWLLTYLYTSLCWYEHYSVSEFLPVIISTVMRVSAAGGFNLSCSCVLSQEETRSFNDLLLPCSLTFL